MTTAAAAFACTVLLAFLQGFGLPAFTGIIAADAFEAALPFLGILVVARYAARRLTDNVRDVERIHAIVQGMLVGTGFAWWWLEPHATLTDFTGSSIVATAWVAVAGGLYGAVAFFAAARTSSPLVAREIALGGLVVFLSIGGFVYRSFDHVESGARLGAALGIVAVTLLAAAGTWFSLRGREKLAGGIPALTPALAGLALLLASMLGAPAATSTAQSVLVVLVDTLRADIADEGFDGQTNVMPHLARIATKGVRFTQAVSPAPWTLPATVSLLSGWNPHRHGYGRSVSSWEVLRGDPGAFHMVGDLRDAGYLTSAFVHNPYLRPWYGFDGFYMRRPYHGRAIDGVALAFDWMRKHVDGPTFTLLHLMDPHWPYEAPAEPGKPRGECAGCDSLYEIGYRGATAEMRAEIRRRYTSEVRYTDTMLGYLYDNLAASGALEHTWIIVTADHGEEFWEHDGFLHGHTLNDELLRVPLVVIPPHSPDPAPGGNATDAAAATGAAADGNSAAAVAPDRNVAAAANPPALPTAVSGEFHVGRRVNTPVRLEDVAATILDITGLDVSAARDGASLLPLLRGTEETTPRTSVAGYIKSPVDLRYAVRRFPYKGVMTPSVPGWSALYDLARDPGENRNLLFNPELAPLASLAVSIAWKELLAEPARLGLVVERQPETGSGSAGGPDADTKRQLRSLGYVD